MTSVVNLRVPFAHFWCNISAMAGTFAPNDARIVPTGSVLWVTLGALGQIGHASTIPMCRPVKNQTNFD